MTRNTPKRALAVFLTGLMLLSVAAATPVAAQPQLSISASDPGTVSAGDTFTVTYTVQNSGDQEEASLLVDTSDTLPSSVSVQDVSAPDATTIQGETAFFTDLSAGDSVEVTATYLVAGSASEGDYDVGARAEGNSGSTDSTTATATVETGAGEFTGLSPSSVSPAVDITVRQGQDISINEDRELDEVTVDLADSDLSGVGTGDFELYVEGTPYGGDFDSFSTSSGELTAVLDDSITVSDGDNVFVEIEDVEAPAQTGDYDIETSLYEDGDRITDYSDTLTVETDGEDEDEDPPVERYDSGTTVDTINAEDSDAPWDDGTAFQGQVLWFATTDSQSADYQLHEAQTDDDGDVTGVGTFVRDLDLQEANTTGISLSGDYNAATIATENLDEDTYVIALNGQIVDTDSEGTMTGTGGTTAVTIVQQDFEAEWDTDSVAQDGSEEITLESNRGDYTVGVGASGLDNDELLDIFEDAGAYEFDDVVLIPIDSTDDELDANFDNIDQGDYTFGFEVTDTGDTATAPISVGAAAEEQANFEDRTIIEQRGDVAEFTLNLENTETAAIVLGSDDVNYRTTVSLEDTDEDGQVSVEVNTFEAGRIDSEADAWEEGDDTDIIAVNRHTDQLDDPIEAHDYSLSAQIGGEETDVGTLFLRERATMDAASWTAPGDESDTEDALDMATMDDTTAQSDWAVAQFNVSGVYGYLSEDTSSTSDGDLGNGMNLIIEESGGVNQAGDDYTLNDDVVELETDEENDTFYLFLDTEEVDTGDYEATFEISDEDYEGDNPYVDDDESESASTTFEVVEREASFDTNDDGDVVVESADNQTVAGETNVAPGTEINIQATTSGEGAFFKDQETVVQDDGSFSSQFDFSNVESNTTFTVSIPNEGFDDNAATPGRVAEAPEGSVTINNQTTDGSTVTVASASLSDGGFVTIHDASVLEGALFDSVRGTSAYLEAGSHSDIEVSLDTPYEEAGTAIAMPHLDTDGDESYDFVSSEGADDGPYTDADGNAVVDSATLTIATPTPTEPPTTAPPTEPPTTEPPATEPPTATPTSGQQPGFGLVVALLALVAAALIAVRRD